MAKKYWLGTVDGVKQVSTCTVTAFDVATTYKLTVGVAPNTRTVSAVGNTSTTVTATDLTAAWNASTNPYFTPVTASSVGAVITLTSDDGGLPFTVASSVTGGTGTISAISTTTTATGPNFWDNASNWSDGVVPVSTDDVIIADSAINIMHGLDQSAVALTSLTIFKSYTGKIGLDYRAVATKPDGATTDATEAEYRGIYLKIGTAKLDIGENFAKGAPAGSARLLIDLGSVTASTVEIFGTASASDSTGRSAVRLKAAVATTDLFVRSAPGGVGLAAEIPGETSTVRDIVVNDQSGTSQVRIGEGTTLTNWKQNGGTNFLEKSSGTVTTLDMDGGTLTTEGVFQITTANLRQGTLNMNNTHGTASIVTLNHKGGTLNTLGTGESRTITTYNPEPGSTIVADGQKLTITNYNEPTRPFTYVMT